MGGAQASSRASPHDSAFRADTTRSGALYPSYGFAPLCAQPLRRRHIDPESGRVEDDGIEIGRGLDGNVALAHVLLHQLYRPLQWITVATAAARADLEGVAGLELRH